MGGKAIAFALLAMSLAQPALAQGDAAAACAAVARYPTPDDPTGRFFEGLDPDTAILPCEAAIAADAVDHASRANLARALAKADRYSEVTAHLRFTQGPLHTEAIMTKPKAANVEIWLRVDVRYAA